MDENTRIQLELIAAKAKQLAQGGLWDGELTSGLREIREALNRINTQGGRL